jgi:hypothetical protein
VRVLAIDPRSVALAGGPGAADDAKTVVALDAGESAGKAVVLEAGAFVITETPRRGAAVVARGAAGGAPLAAAICVADESGFAYYLEPVVPARAAADDGDGADGAAARRLAPRGLGEREARSIVELAGRLGCSQHVALAAPMALALGGDTALDGAAVHPPRGATAVTLVRGQAPGGRRMFEDTPVVPFKEWYRLQKHRVRYFKKHDE